MQAIASIAEAFVCARREMQIQMRDIPGFVETRRKLVTLKSANRIHWIAYAVGNHMNGLYTNAIKVGMQSGCQDENTSGLDEESIGCLCHFEGRQNAQAMSATQVECDNSSS